MSANELETRARGLTAGRITMALFPYLIVIAVFSVAKLVGTVKAWLATTDVKIPWPGLDGNVLTAAGTKNSSTIYTLPWLSGPGTSLLICSLITAVVYGVSMAAWGKELKDTAYKMRFAFLTVASVLALAYVIACWITFVIAWPVLARAYGTLDTRHTLWTFVRIAVAGGCAWLAVRLLEVVAPVLDYASGNSRGQAVVSLSSLCLTVLVVFLTAVLFSMAGLINAVFANSFDDISIVPTFILTPLTYLGGVFYSIDLLAPFWRVVSQANPILHMVNAFRYGVCAIAKMLHDVLILLGLAALMGVVAGWEMDALFLTAVLTVVGFSVQDVIVVFDRIRENITRHRDEDYETIVNRSLLETLHRSLATQLNAIFVMVAIILFGGATMRQFMLTMLVGMVTGTYSSIFFAVPLLVVWEKGALSGLRRLLARRGASAA